MSRFCSITLYLTSVMVSTLEATDLSAGALTVVSGNAGFTSVPAPRTGIAFTNTLTDLQIATNRLLEDGAGVALGDVDGNRRCDIYFCRLDGPKALYRSPGHWTFTDIAETAGVAYVEQFSTGAVVADLDGDEDLDLLAPFLGEGTLLGNTTGLGATVRWGRGPVPLISGGGGYWSQDSAVSVLAAPSDGQAAPIPATVREVRLSISSQLDIVR